MPANAKPFPPGMFAFYGIVLLAIFIAALIYFAPPQPDLRAPGKESSFSRQHDGYSGCVRWVDEPWHCIRDNQGVQHE